MPWARISDDFYDHPKVDALPAGIRLACVGLHILAITWSNRFLTDGVVPDDRIRKLGGKPTHRRALIEAGLWDELEVGCIEVHDFHDYNPTRESILADRAAARDRMEKVRRSRGVTRRSPEQEAELRPGVQATFGRSSAYPDPTRPDPTESRPDSNQSSPTTPKRRRAGLTVSGEPR